MKRVFLAIVTASAILTLYSQTPPSPPSRQAQEGKAARPQGDSLTGEQRRKMREASDKLREQQTPHYEKMRSLRNEMDALTRAENVDESAIRAKALEIGRIEGELAVIRAKHFQELRGILPKEQFEQIQNRPGAVGQRLQSIVARTNTPPLVRPQAGSSSTPGPRTRPATPAVPAPGNQ